MTVDTASSRPNDQRSLIAKAAAELFARKGYAATSMNEIAEASHLSKPGLYHHFKDKAEVLLHIADGHVSRLVDIVTGVEALQLAPDERLPELIEAFMAEYAEAQHEHRVLTEDVRFLAPRRRRACSTRSARWCGCSPTPSPPRAPTCTPRSCTSC